MIDLNKVLTKIIETQYPVGSCMSMPTNTNPATVIGYGTWTLIDKHFESQWKSIEPTWNSTLIKTSDDNFLRCTMGKDSIEFTFMGITKISTSDTSYTIFSIDPADIGCTSTLPTHIFHSSIDTATDGGLGQVRMSVNESTGKLDVIIYDVVTRTGSSIAANNELWGHCMAVITDPTNKLDSFCNEFIFQRVA